jgi:hypothetical protein
MLFKSIGLNAAFTFILLKGSGTCQTGLNRFSYFDTARCFVAVTILAEFAAYRENYSLRTQSMMRVNLWMSFGME